MTRWSRIAELSPLLARVRIPEHAATSVRIGEPAVVKMLDGGSVPAHVARLSPAFDPASGTREAVLQVEGGSLLLPGATVQVRLGRQQRLAVPREHLATGTFVAAPARLQVATAPSDGVVAEMLVDEGMRVDAGAPLLRVRNFEHLHALVAASRLVDSRPR